MSTWVDGIGPPLEQLAEDHEGLPLGRTSQDILALIHEVQRLRASLADAGEPDPRG